MIILDTNVISELWEPRPDANVLAWMDVQTAETLYLSAITIAEIRFGLTIMPEGKRRAGYSRRFDQELLPAFSGRILSFDTNAAQIFAELMARARKAGKAISKEDGYIAATALAHNMAVATRDASPFEAAGLTVINPWEAR